MKRKCLKNFLCLVLAGAMTSSMMVSVRAEEAAQSVSPVLNLDIADYTGFMQGGVLQDTVSGKNMQTTNGTNMSMTGINYGIYKEEQNGTPYLYVDGMAYMTGLNRTGMDQMSVEMWIATDENTPQNAANIYSMFNSNGNVAARCFTTTTSKNGGETYRALKFGGQGQNYGNDWYNCDQNTGWNHVVVTQHMDEQAKINTHLYVNGKYIGRSVVSVDQYNNSTGSSYITDINSIRLGGHKNGTYNLSTEDANTLGGNSKFYLGEFKVYDKCLDNKETNASNISLLYDEDKTKYNFLPSRSNISDDGAVIDLDIVGSNVVNKVNAADIVKPVSGEEFTKGYINNPGKALPYITVNGTNKGYIIDSERFERLPEQTYEMWIRLKDPTRYSTMLSVGNDGFTNQQSFRMADGSYNQVKSEFNGNKVGLMYGDPYSWFKDGENNDEWIHVAVSRYMAMESDVDISSNITSAKYYSAVYVNGKPLSETVYTKGNAGSDYTQSVINNLQNICLGSKNGENIAEMDIAKFKVYDRFVKPTEIKNIYDLEKGMFKNNYSNDFSILKIEPLDLQFAKSIFVRSTGTKYIDAFADSRGGKLNVTFSTPVNPESVTEDSVSIYKDGNEIKGGVSILGLSEQGYCLNIEYGALDVQDKDTYTLKINGLQNLNGIALYDEKEFTVQNNSAAFSAEDITVSSDQISYLKSGYTVENAILDIKPFNDKTIKVTTNYDISDFDGESVSISDMTGVSAVYADREVNITANEAFISGKEYTVTVDGKSKVFTAEEMPGAVTVGNVLYTDKDGYIIEDISEMQNTTEVNAVVNITVRDDTDVSGTDFSVILAVYDERGTLVAVDKKDSNMTSESGVQQFYANVEGLNDKATYRVKATVMYNGAEYISNNTKTFVWNMNEGALTPLSSVK